MHLAWIDLLIVLAYVGATILAGAIARSSIKDISDFLVAGRTLKTHLSVATLVSTELGLVTVMYFAEEGFNNGFAPFVVGIIHTITTIIIGYTGFIVSRLRHLKVMTVPEFYELKYSRGVRLLGGSILALAGTLNMGLFPILGSKFVVGFTGLPAEWVTTVMVAMLVVVVFYTLMGGMVSVVLTDFAQFVLLSLGFLFGTFSILTHPKLGWSKIVAAVELHKGAAGFDPILNDSFGWIFLVYFFNATLIGVVWQPNITRALSTENTRVARLVFRFVAPTVMGRAVIPMLWGAASLAFFNDPNLDGQFTMPAMMGQILPLGLAGLLLAGMFAAFMSTHDSYLLAWSGVIVRDIVSPIRAMLAGNRQQMQKDKPLDGLSSTQEIFWTRIIVLILAVFLALFGMLYRLPETAFKFMYITGSLYLSGAVGTVALGLYWKRANTVGAYCALILGALAPINFLVMSQLPEQIPRFLRPLVESSNLPALLSLVLGGAGMIIGALLTQKSHPPRRLNFSDME